MELNKYETKINTHVLSLEANSRSSWSDMGVARVLNTLNMRKGN